MIAQPPDLPRDADLRSDLQGGHRRPQPRTPRLPACSFRGSGAGCAPCPAGGGQGRCPRCCRSQSCAGEPWGAAVCTPADGRRAPLLSLNGSSAACNLPARLPALQGGATTAACSRAVQVASCCPCPLALATRQVLGNRLAQTCVQRRLASTRAWGAEPCNNSRCRRALACRLRPPSRPPLPMRSGLPTRPSCWCAPCLPDSIASVFVSFFWLFLVKGRSPALPGAGCTTGLSGGSDGAALPAMLGDRLGDECTPPWACRWGAASEPVISRGGRHSQRPALAPENSTASAPLPRPACPLQATLKARGSELPDLKSAPQVGGAKGGVGPVPAGTVMGQCLPARRATQPCLPVLACEAARAQMPLGKAVPCCDRCLLSSCACRAPCARRPRSRR